MNDQTQNAETTKAATQTAVETLDTLRQAGQAALESTVEAGATAAREAYETTTNLGTAQLQGADKAYEQARRAGAEGLAGCQEAANAGIAGLDAWAEQVNGFARANADEGFDQMSRLMGAGNAEELVRAQVEAGARTIERATNQWLALNRIALDTANRMQAPLRERVTAAMGNAPAAGK